MLNFPQELKCRILIKGKKDTPHLGQLGKTSSSASFSSSSEEEPAGSNKKDPSKVRPGTTCRSLQVTGYGAKWFVNVILLRLWWRGISH